MALGGSLSKSKAEGPSAASAQALLSRGGEARVRLPHRQTGLPGGRAAFPESHEHPCSAVEAGIWHACFPSKDSGAVSTQRWELHAQCPAQSWSSNPRQKQSGTFPCLPPLLPHIPPAHLAPRGAPSATTRAMASGLYLPLSQPRVLLFPSQGLGQEDVYAQMLLTQARAQGKAGTNTARQKVKFARRKREKRQQ